MRIYRHDLNKPLEQRVREAILKKLYVKVDSTDISMDKEAYIALLLEDIAAIAKAEYDTDKALKSILKKNKNEIANPILKKQELEIINENYTYEIDAYLEYVNSKKEKNLSDDQIVENVYFILNSEIELLEKRISEVLSEYLKNQFNNGVSFYDLYELPKSELIRLVVLLIKLLASNINFEEAFQEYYTISELNRLLKDRQIEDGRTRLKLFSEFYKKETNAYKMALSINEQNGEIGESVAVFKKMLGLDEND